jgi:hypothetical protein
MKRSVMIATLAVLITLCLGFWAVYGQEARNAGTQPSLANMVIFMMRLLDLNKDGRISQSEYMRLFVDADQDMDRSVTQQEMTRFINERRQEMIKQGQEASGPNVGQQAPDFTLRTLDGKTKVRLSDFRGKKPVVLVFGSYT